MNDYIKIPKWIYIEEISSDNIETFLKDVKYIEDKKIDMECLREYYKTNKRNFLDLIHELALRGFEFFTNKENNILPKSSYNEYEEYIFSDRSLDKYLNIDFEKFAIGNFILRFNVKDDSFFNYVPLKGFKIINPNISIEEIKFEFISKGFKIDRAIKSSSEKNLDVDIDIIKKIENNESISEKNISIDMHFAERKYQLFRQFCKSNNIKYISEINFNVMDNFSKEKGIGVSKIKDIEEKIIEYNDEKQESQNMFLEYMGNMTLEKILTKKMYKIFKEFCYNYEFFKEFCDDKNIENIIDIKDYNIAEFLKLKWVIEYRTNNLNTIEEIKTIIKESKDKQMIVNIKEDVYTMIKDLTIVDVLGKCGYQYNEYNWVISEIQGENSSEIIDDINIEDINEIYKCIAFLNKLESPKNILNKIRDDLSERQNYVLNCRFKEGFTLQETAEAIGGITRERIRQIELKSLNKIIKQFHIKGFIKSIRLFSKNQLYLSKEELLRVLGEENIYFANIIIQNNVGNIFYFQPFDIIYFKEYEINISNLKKLVDTLPDIFLIDDYIEDIEDILGSLYKDNIEIEKLENLLKYYDYKQYGKYFSKKSLSIVDIMDIIFQENIKKPLKVDEEGINVIRNIFKNIFSYELSDSNRAIEARVRDAENVILVDKKTFCHISNMTYDESIMDLIEKYIDKELEKRNEINIEEVFFVFKDLCKKNNIEDKRALYSLVKFNLGDKYNIGQGNTLNIFSVDIKEKYSKEDRLVIYLKERNGIALKKDIMTSFKWKQFKLDDAVSKSDKLIMWGSDKITLIDNIVIDETIKCKLKNIINECMIEGFSTSAVILRKMLFDTDLNQFLRTNNIDESMKLATIIRSLFKNIKGHTNFLYTEDSKYTSFVEVIENKFADITYREEIKKFIISYGYKEVMALQIIKNLIQEKKYIEISQDEFIPYHKLNLAQETIDCVVEEILSRMNGKQYISLSDIKGYRTKLPEIQYKWNPYLIKFILDGNKFRGINKFYRDYRYDKVIVAIEESRIYTFEDLIYYILKNEYKGNLHEIKVYDYLANIGILRQQDEVYSKKLPYEIYNSKRIKIDTLGRIELIEV